MEESKPPKREKIKELNYELWIKQGVACCYTKFQGPVSPGDKSEPVYEFHLRSGPKRDPKYLVDEMYYTPLGLIWKRGPFMDVTPLANIVQSKFIFGN